MVENNVATVTLNRPAVRNAITLAMWKNVARIFAELGVKRDVRAIIFAGAGGNFSVGADVSEFSVVRSNAQDSADYEIAVDAASEAIASVPQPVVAAIDGYCLGGGCHLSMACDFRFASPAAEIGIPSANLSIVYGVQSTKRLLGLVGLTAAKHMLYTAERLGGSEALRIGLVDRLNDHPREEARRFATQIAGKAPLSIAGAKYILNQASMGEDGALAQTMIDHASDSEDYREARLAFAEKRRPAFKGL
ncbi:MAG: enoyl-CoA hydratase/isomerase family protein [Xanthobacteraceae bacterium]